MTGQRPSLQSVPDRALAPALIDARGLTRSYDEGRVQALRGVDFGVDAGEFVAIIGPSGCGKSTLLSLLGALESPESGTLRFRGEPYPTPARAYAFRSRSVGFVFQSFHLLPTLTAAENIEVPMLEGSLSASQRRDKIAALLSAVGLSARAQHRPGALSGGERQRVAIARALANDPALLLADEPTGNLDSVNAQRVVELLASLHRERGMTIVMVTHDAQVAGHAQRIVRMRDGRVVAEQEEAA